MPDSDFWSSDEDEDEDDQTADARRMYARLRRMRSRSKSPFDFAALMAKVPMLAGVKYSVAVESTAISVRDGDDADSVLTAAAAGAGEGSPSAIVKTETDGESQSSPARDSSSSSSSDCALTSPSKNRSSLQDSIEGVNRSTTASSDSPHSGSAPSTSSPLIVSNELPRILHHKDDEVKVCDTSRTPSSRDSLPPCADSTRSPVSKDSSDRACRSTDSTAPEDTGRSSNSRSVPHTPKTPSINEFLSPKTSNFRGSSSSSSSVSESTSAAFTASVSATAQTTESSDSPPVKFTPLPKKETNSCTTPWPRPSPSPPPPLAGKAGIMTPSPVTKAKSSCVTTPWPQHSPSPSPPPQVPHDPLPHPPFSAAKTPAARDSRSDGEGFTRSPSAMPSPGPPTCLRGSNAEFAAPAASQTPHEAPRTAHQSHFHRSPSVFPSLAPPAAVGKEAPASVYRNTADSTPTLQPHTKANSSLRRSPSVFPSPAPPAALGENAPASVYRNTSTPAPRAKANASLHAPTPRTERRSVSTCTVDQTPAFRRRRFARKVDEAKYDAAEGEGDAEWDIEHVEKYTAVIVESDAPQLRTGDHSASVSVDSTSFGSLSCSDSTGGVYKAQTASTRTFGTQTSRSRSSSRAPPAAAADTGDSSSHLSSAPRPPRVAAASDSPSVAPRDHVLKHESVALHLQTQTPARSSPVEQSLFAAAARDGSGTVGNPILIPETPVVENGAASRVQGVSQGGTSSAQESGDMLLKDEVSAYSVSGSESENDATSPPGEAESGAQEISVRMPSPPPSAANIEGASIPEGGKQSEVEVSSTNDAAAPESDPVKDEAPTAAMDTSESSSPFAQAPSKEKARSAGCPPGNTSTNPIVVPPTPPIPTPMASRVAKVRAQRPPPPPLPTPIAKQLCKSAAPRPNAPPPSVNAPPAFDRERNDESRSGDAPPSRTPLSVRMGRRVDDWRHSKSPDHGVLRAPLPHASSEPQTRTPPTPPVPTPLAKVHRSAAPRVSDGDGESHEHAPARRLAVPPTPPVPTPLAKARKCRAPLERDAASSSQLELAGADATPAHVPVAAMCVSDVGESCCDDQKENQRSEKADGPSAAANQNDSVSPVKEEASPEKSPSPASPKSRQAPGDEQSRGAFEAPCIKESQKSPVTQASPSPKSPVAEASPSPKSPVAAAASASSTDSPDDSRRHRRSVSLSLSAAPERKPRIRAPDSDELSAREPSASPLQLRMYVPDRRVFSSRTPERSVEELEEQPTPKPEKKFLPPPTKSSSSSQMQREPSPDDRIDRERKFSSEVPTPAAMLKGVAIAPPEPSVSRNLPHAHPSPKLRVREAASQHLRDHEPPQPTPTTADDAATAPALLSDRFLSAAKKYALPPPPASAQSNASCVASPGHDLQSYRIISEAKKNAARASAPLYADTPAAAPSPSGSSAGAAADNSPAHEAQWKDGNALSPASIMKVKRRISFSSAQKMSIKKRKLAEETNAVQRSSSQENVETAVEPVPSDSVKPRAGSANPRKRVLKQKVREGRSRLSTLPIFKPGSAPASYVHESSNVDSENRVAGENLRHRELSSEAEQAMVNDQVAETEPSQPAPGEKPVDASFDEMMDAGDSDGVDSDTDVESVPPGTPSAASSSHRKDSSRDISELERKQQAISPPKSAEKDFHSGTQQESAPSVLHPSSPSLSPKDGKASPLNAPSPPKNPSPHASARASFPSPPQSPMSPSNSSGSGASSVAPGDSGSGDRRSSPRQSSASSAPRNESPRRSLVASSQESESCNNPESAGVASEAAPSSPPSSFSSSASRASADQNVFGTPRSPAPGTVGPASLPAVVDVSYSPAHDEADDDTHSLRSPSASGSRRSGNSHVCGTPPSPAAASLPAVDGVSYSPPAHDEADDDVHPVPSSPSPSTAENDGLSPSEVERKHDLGTPDNSSNVGSADIDDEDFLPSTPPPPPRGAAAAPAPATANTAALTALTPLSPEPVARLLVAEFVSPAPFDQSTPARKGKKGVRFADEDEEEEEDGEEEEKAKRAPPKKKGKRRREKRQELVEVPFNNNPPTPCAVPRRYPKRKTRMPPLKYWANEQIYFRVKPGGGGCEATGIYRRETPPSTARKGRARKRRRSSVASSDISPSPPSPSPSRSQSPEFAVPKQKKAKRSRNVKNPKPKAKAKPKKASRAREEEEPAKGGADDDGGDESVSRCASSGSKKKKRKSELEDVENNRPVNAKRKRGKRRKKASE